MSSHLNRRAALLLLGGGAGAAFLSACGSSSSNAGVRPHPQRVLQVVRRPQRTGLKLVVLPAVLRLR